jgi:hypothetical protein
MVVKFHCFQKLLNVTLFNLPFFTRCDILLTTFGRFAGFGSTIVAPGLEMFAFANMTFPNPAAFGLLFTAPLTQFAV